MVIVCEVCGSKYVSHSYAHKDYCEYHYWVARGKPKDDLTQIMWQGTRKRHPRLVKKWIQQDAELKEFLYYGYFL
jgi:hypothetical protein